MEERRWFDPIEEAIDELRKGQVVIVCDDEDRENEGDFVALSENIDAQTINFMITHGRGLVCTPITEEQAELLQLQPMADQNTDPHGTAFTVSVDHVSSKTGISASERALTIQQLANQTAEPGDFQRPGHVFPLIAKEGGVLQRAGHTEAAIDLARLSGKTPSGTICEITREDGEMARVPELREIADRFGLKMVTIKDLISYRRHREKLVKREADTSLPTEFGDFRALGFTSSIDGKEMMALVKGKIDPEEETLVRVHSECLTGDVFGSKRCDCGPQLQAALMQIEKEGKGVLLYMRQEGRGIGLINKLKAYELQEAGYDTVEANKKLGFPDDLREYGIGAQVLRDIGVGKMKLLTNNPRKITGISGYGLEVTQRIAIQLPLQEENEKYMRTKFQKLGHMLHF
ncbi:bifunctional 3,4-dihydroxy-2-butanone-4-phosphate synthase/GTP cyclohydrolase II [Marinococcus halophilus]|uniref:Riboflavin biosynthesis protein RibBA n=1 Tax=Marinococcus halophilus TaxID=1371 RepID=A0A510Y638_MARHA|nr:bifunctional 3,4-dihydroxy-2-butanone-4-phosphate synthase/GTP cyclohydrolase II [Marinococcus halophilus]OZT80891.1 bifunctional 3,4-dihydroxy-2-butanone-4-phosphate synthase/GTP cyclohydrolase II [Marinococcus halophilus]GEK57947.1 riboflavin biosynthesis protein RibBA [Marinococcus halophilus]